MDVKLKSWLPQLREAVKKQPPPGNAQLLEMLIESHEEADEKIARFDIRVEALESQLKAAREENARVRSELDDALFACGEAPRTDPPSAPAVDEERVERVRKAFRVAWDTMAHVDINIDRDKIWFDKNPTLIEAMFGLSDAIKALAAAAAEPVRRFAEFLDELGSEERYEIAIRVNGFTLVAARYLAHLAGKEPK
jgi:hypothetical protein